MLLNEPSAPDIRFQWATQNLRYAILDLRNSVGRRLESAAYIFARDALQKMQTAEWLMRGYECPFDLLQYIRSEVSIALQNLPDASEEYCTAMAGVLADIDKERGRRKASS